MFRDSAYNESNFTLVGQEFINEVLYLERRYGFDEAFELHDMAQDLFNRSLDVDQKLDVIYGLIDFINKNQKTLGSRKTRMLHCLNKLIRMLNDKYVKVFESIPSKLLR